MTDDSISRHEIESPAMWIALVMRANLYLDVPIAFAPLLVYAATQSSVAGKYV